MELFPFQKTAVDFFDIQRSVLCADEMGTGKSYIGTARDMRIRTKFKGKTLVVATMSTLDMWRRMFEAEGFKVRVINPKKRELLFKQDADVYVVHWAALQQRGGHWLTPDLMEVQFMHVIADEVHHAQNRNAQQTIGLKRIKTVFKTGLSGTPITNTPDKFWSVLNWLYPVEFSSYWRFYGKFVDFEIDSAGGYRKIKGPKNVPLLHEKIRSYYLRRLKEEVLPELPDKYYTEIEVTLTDKQQKAYDEMRQHMITWLDDQPLVAPVVVAQLMRLSQFSNAYAKVGTIGKVELTEPSSKLDALMEVIDSQSQVVVFSQFAQMIDLLQARLKKKGITYSRITGTVPQFMRQRAVDNFQSGESQVFMGTIAAGGEGITLTSGSCVVFLDRSYSPAMNSQAEDRLHRMGQKNAVQVIDIMSKGTIDQGRKTKLELKEDWLRKLLDP